VKCLRRGDGILTRHGIDNEEDLVRLDALLDGFNFFHHPVVHVQTTCGINDHDITRILPGMLDGLHRNLNRRSTGGMMNRKSDACRQFLELVNGRWTVDIGCGKERVPPLGLEGIPELGTKCCLSRTLETRH
jgi:hypothetical protein